MTGNPYSPPAAAVADIPPIPTPERKPWQIRAAVATLWAFVCSALFFLLVRLPDEGIHAGAFALLGLIGVLTIKISAGRPWARTVFVRRMRRRRFTHELQISDLVILQQADHIRQPRRTPRGHFLR
jgi:hypothetical protein